MAEKHKACTTAGQDAPMIRQVCTCNAAALQIIVLVCWSVSIVLPDTLWSGSYSVYYLDLSKRADSIPLSPCFLSKSNAIRAHTVCRNNCWLKLILACPCSQCLIQHRSRYRQASILKAES